MKLPLPVSFYRSADVIAIARALLGKELFTQIDGALTAGIIVETEAYAGASDRASHAYNHRRTPRTEVMYRSGGIAYVYLCYGIHCLLNAVTAEEGIPHAVLIRAIKPTQGIEEMKKRRKKNTPLAEGPGALCQALGITLEHNGLPLTGSAIWIADTGYSPKNILISPRIGVAYAGSDALLPYRFYLKADALK